jgi:L-malate glycosyltransferase
VELTGSATKRIEVTILIKSLGLGGAERLLVDALPYLDQERFTYRIAYVTPWKDALAPVIAAEGFEVTCLGRPELKHPAAPSPSKALAYSPPRSVHASALLPSALARLMHMLERTRCELLHADLPAAGIVARIAGKLLGVPVVYTEHNLQERYHPLTRWANRITYGWNEVVLAVSDEVAASIRRNGLDGRTDLRTLPNGVPVETIRAEAEDLDDLRRDLDLPNGRPVVGSVAVFRPQKRLFDWLEVARQLAAMHDDVLFLLVGDGPEMPALRRRIHDIGLGERIRLPGFREDGRRLIGLIDVYLMTSAFEGLPMAMLEAMALGKPIVATAVGGIPEVIVPGKQGFLAPVGNTDLLAAQTAALVSNSGAAKEMGERGVVDVSIRYHTRDRVRAIEATYLEILGQ